MGIARKLKLNISKKMDIPVEYQHDEMLKRWVIAELEKIPEGSLIIDVGAGEQPYKKYCKHLRYKSQDFCEYSGEGDGTGLQMGKWDTSKVDIVSDIVSIPVEDDIFDAVLCTEVFEHIPDPVIALRELYRILKRGGVLILTAPFMSETHFAPYHFCSGFDRYWYQYHLNNVGFSECRVTSYGNLFSNFLTSLNIVIHSGNVKFIDKMIGIIFRKAFIKYVVSDSTNSENIACYGWNVVAKK